MVTHQHIRISNLVFDEPHLTLTLGRCTCQEEVPVCTCSMSDLLEMAVKLIKQQDKILKEGDSVTEALDMRVSKGGV